jgi:hypothetical protein
MEGILPYKPSLKPVLLSRPSEGGKDRRRPNNDTASILCHKGMTLYLVVSRDLAAKRQSDKATKGISVSLSHWRRQFEA